MKYYKFWGETYTSSFYTPPTGKPIEIGLCRFLWLIIFKYLVVCVPDNATKKEIILAVVSKLGIHKDSYFAKESLKLNGEQSDGNNNTSLKDWETRDA